MVRNDVIALLCKPMQSLHVFFSSFRDCRSIGKSTAMLSAISIASILERLLCLYKAVSLNQNIRFQKLKTGLVKWFLVKETTIFYSEMD